MSILVFAVRVVKVNTLLLLPLLLLHSDKKNLFICCSCAKRRQRMELSVNASHYIHTHRNVRALSLEAFTYH